MSETYDKKAVGARLALFRASQGYGLRPFARHMEVDHTKLNHWEKGTHYPDISFIAALHRRYGLTSDWVYFGEQPGMPQGLLDALRAVERQAAAQAAVSAPEEQNS